MSKPKVLIMDDPTRGIDVGTKFEIYKLMNDLAEQGIAIIMISSDLEEVIGMSDRIMVMHEGKSTGMLNTTDAYSVDEIIDILKDPLFNPDAGLNPLNQYRLLFLRLLFGRHRRSPCI